MTKKNKIKDFQNGCGTSDLRMTRTQSFGLEAEPDHASKSQTRDNWEMKRLECLKWKRRLMAF